MIQLFELSTIQGEGCFSSLRRETSAERIQGQGMCKLSLGEFFFSAIFVRRCLYFRSNVLPFIFFSSLILSVSYGKRYFGKSCGCALLGYLNTNLPFLGPFSAIGKVRY